MSSADHSSLKTSSPEPSKETPTYVAGRLAVCMHCGYLSEDFNNCLRCKTKLPEDVKSVLVSDQNNLKTADSFKQQHVLAEDKKIMLSKFNSKLV